VVEVSADGTDVLDEADLLALSDAFSGEDNDSCPDDESGNDSEASGSCAQDEEESEDEEDAFAEDGSILAKKGKGSKKARGNYACSKCGLPKRGHICAFQPRVRRRGASAALAAAAAARLPSTPGAPGSSAMAAMAAAAGGGAVRPAVVKQASARPAARPKAAASSGPAQRCEMAAGPSVEFTLRAALSAGAGSASAGSGSGSSVAAPVTCSTGSQCELDGANAVRELYLDAQGFPESYAGGILNDPTFCLATARTVTVSRPPPKSYCSKASASCGAGPDAVSVASAPLVAGHGLGGPFGLAGLLGAHASGSLSATASDPLSLLRAPGGHPASGGGLTLNHLALLMSSYQHSIAQQGVLSGAAAASAASGGTAAAAAAGAGGAPRDAAAASAGMDLASLFYPMSGLSGLHASALLGSAAE